jgi:hypothetical protein
MCLELTAPAAVDVSLRSWTDRFLVAQAAAIGWQRECGPLGGGRSAGTSAKSVMATFECPHPPVLTVWAASAKVKF